MEQQFNDKAVALWNEISTGNKVAFGQLMEAFYADFFKYGFSLCSNEELVKDCIQNVFLTVWQNRHSLKPIIFVRFYLLKSLRREIFKQSKRERKENYDSELFVRTVEDVLPAKVDLIISKENQLAVSKKVMEVMSSLSKRQQEIIYLRFYLDMKPEEIADIISISRQSVYNLLSDSLKRLKSKL